MLGRLVEGDDFRAANGGVKLGWDEMAFFVQVTNGECIPLRLESGPEVGCDFRAMHHVESRGT